MFINKTKRAKAHLSELQSVSVSAENFEILESPAQFKQAIITQIRNAKKRIYITALYWQLDEAGQEIAQEIYQAKAANPDLDIKIFVDWHRAQRTLIGAEKGQTNADWYCEQANKYGVNQLFWGVPINTREVFGVLHVKGFVFDDTILYSGASINNVYLQQFERYRFDRYQQINNAELADSFVQFLKQYVLLPDSVHPLDCQNPPKTKEIRHNIKAFRKHLATFGQYVLPPASQSAVLNSTDLIISPLFGLGTKHNLLNRTIEDLFLLVEDKLVICTPYFNFPRTLQGKIRHLLREGKTVEIIVGDKTANDFFIPPEEPFKMAGALPYLYERNLRAFTRKFSEEIAQGRLVIRLWKHNDNSYHLKGLWIDDQYLLITGNNLNPRAWRLDAENGLLVQDKYQLLKEKVAQELANIRQHTTVLSHYTELQDMDDYPEPVQRLLKRFARVKADKLIKLIL